MSMTKQKWFNVGLAVAAGAALVLGLVAFNTANQPEARGSTNFGSVTLGSAITDIERIQGVMRTYDGVDYYADVVVSDMDGTPNNGWQAAYNITDWDSETTMTAFMAEAMVDNTTVTSGCELYGGDFIARIEGLGTGDTQVATNTTAIALFGEVQASYTTTIPTAYAIYGQLEVASGSTIEDGVVFYADLYGAGDITLATLMSVKSGDTYNYGIDLNPATAISSADIRFQNGTELEEVTDTVLTFSEFLAAEEQTPVVVTAGSTITPTGTYQPITSEAVVTTSTSTAIADGVVNGQLLILINENASDAITIDDGGNTNLSGDAVLGPDDTLLVFWDGADWQEIAQANNT